ncbi:excalibur calcium-binding protein [Streptomyces poriticola]|uniref:excalibur calcium-binding protein n=1 Tax=Streptomyces poriticola TaxID=3120506 RepID=UPI002FCE1BFB
MRPRRTAAGLLIAVTAALPAAGAAHGQDESPVRGGTDPTISATRRPNPAATTNAIPPPPVAPTTPAPAAPATSAPPAATATPAPATAAPTRGVRGGVGGASTAGPSGWDVGIGLVLVTGAAVAAGYTVRRRRRS